MRQEGRQLGLLWGGVAVALVALAPLATRLAEGVPRCVLKSLSGLPCPTCGTTRAAVALARFDILEALALNPLATVGWALLVVGGLLAGALAIAGRPVREPSWNFGVGLRAALVAALLANWVYLVLAGV